MGGGRNGGGGKAGRDVDFGVCEGGLFSSGPYGGGEKGVSYVHDEEYEGVWVYTKGCRNKLDT